MSEYIRIISILFYGIIKKYETIAIKITLSNNVVETWILIDYVLEFNFK